MEARATCTERACGGEEVGYVAQMLMSASVECQKLMVPASRPVQRRRQAVSQYFGLQSIILAYVDNPKL